LEEATLCWWSLIYIKNFGFVIFFCGIEHTLINFPLTLDQILDHEPLKKRIISASRWCSDNEKNIPSYQTYLVADFLKRDGR
jgi:hypothetical protein